MSDEPRNITDDMMLSELTVGEFKQLVASLLPQASSQGHVVEANTTDKTPKAVTRKSLDEFMSDISTN